MKQILFFIFIASLLSVNIVRAENEVPSVAIDFTGTDIDNNEHHLFDYLDQGKYVCIQFILDKDCGSCVQCSPFVNSAYEFFGCNNGDVVFLAINNGDNNSTVSSYNTDVNQGPGEVINTPTIGGNEGGGTQICQSYGITEYTHIVLIAPDRSVIIQDVPHGSMLEIKNAILEIDNEIGPKSCNAPIADFYTNDEPVIEMPITFYDSSIAPDGYPAVSWYWTFEGGIPETSNEQNPTVMFTTMGNNHVTLEVVNSEGYSTKIKDFDFVANCQIITNIEAGELSEVNYSGSTGYVGGTNNRDVTAYAEHIENLDEFNRVKQFVFVVDQAIADNSASKVRFTIWDGGNSPGVVLGYKDLAVSSLYPNNINVVNFNTPIAVEGDFFAGMEIPTEDGDIVAFYVAPARSSASQNTLMVKQNETWKTCSNVFNVHTSLDLQILGCLVDPDYNDVENVIDYENNMTIFPNPAKDVVNINFSNSEIKSRIEVYNILGSLVNVIKNQDVSGNYVLDFSNQKNGMYILKIRTENEVTTKKIIINK